MGTFDTAAGRSRSIIPAALLAALAVASPLAAQEHDHDHAEEQGHSHGAIHFVHPLFTESISPDTKLRLDYSFDDPGSVSEMELEGEYAFHPTMSIEVGLHIDPETAELGETHLLFKFTNEAFAERGVLLGYGLALGLPTGTAHEHDVVPVPDAGAPGADAGDERIYEFEPFLNGGVMLGDLQVVSWARFRIPTNQPVQNEVATTLAYDLAALYPIVPRVQALLELDGASGMSGAATEDHTLSVAPGLKVRPFADSNVSIGLGAAIPLTADREFDTRALASIFYHF